jgi:hypothetical protein
MFPQFPAIPGFLPYRLSIAKGFYNYQYDPADLVSAKRPLALQRGKPNFGFRVAEDKSADRLHPWDRAALALHGDMIGTGGKAQTVVLVPMGSTILRRTFFPISE